jgi:hypothetical protein
MTLEEFNELKADVEAKRSQAERAKGALSQLELQLKKEHNIEPKDLAKVIAKLEKEIKQEEIEYEKGVTAWHEAWEDKMEMEEE